MNYQGDYKEDSIIYVMFNTFTSNDPSASSTITNFANTDVHIHKDDDLTQRNNAAGITVSVNFDGITGSHMIKIDTSDNTVAGFWVTGKDYFVRIEGTTVDGATINAVVGHFSIENRHNEVDVVKWLGQACHAVSENGVPKVDLDQIGGVVQSLTDFKDLVDTGYDPTNHKIQSDLIYIHGSALTETAGQLAAAFVKLFDVATPLLVASDVMVGTNNAYTGTPPTAAAIVNEWESQSQTDPTGFHVNVKEVNGTAQTANDNGADINSILVDTGTTLDVLIKDIPTNAEFAALLGALNGAAAAGDPTNTDTIMGYIKQLINILIGTAGVVAFPAEAAPANAVSLAEVIRAIHADVTGLNGSAMIGTNNANTVVPDAAGTAPTASEIQTEMEENGASLLDTIRDHTEHATYGLSSLETLVDEVETLLKHATYGLSAIRTRGDAAWITGGGGSISDILNVQPLIPNAIDLANTATVRIGLGLTNMLDDMPSTAEITPGTITIDRKAIGGTSWTNIVNAAACSEIAGLIYYEEVFDSGTGYAAGDTIRITFKSQKIVVAANDYEITGTDGWVFHTYVREAMRGTNSAYTGTPPTVGEIQTEMEENGASLLDTIRDDLANGTDGLGALKTLIDTNKTELDGLQGADGKALISTDAQDLSGTLDVNTKTATATALDLILKDSTFALAIADAIWDEILTGATHNIENSSGRRVREVGAFAIESGTAQTGTSNSITLAAIANGADGVYNRNLVVLTDNTGKGQTRTIVDYDGATKKVVIDRDWRVTPDNTTAYQIVPDDTPLTVDHGVARGGTSTTITIREYASSVNDAYLCNIVTIIAGKGRGQARLVGSYNGTTKVVTICGDNWVEIPDTTSIYVMMPYGTTCTACLTDSALALVNTEIDTALTDYDPPTRTEAITDKDAIITEINANETKIDALNNISVANIIAGIADGSYDLQEMMRIIFAACSGKSAGGGTATLTFRDSGDARNRITATVDSSGNRTGMTLDGS